MKKVTNVTCPKCGCKEITRIIEAAGDCICSACGHKFAPGRTVEVSHANLEEIMALRIQEVLETSEDLHDAIILTFDRAGMVTNNAGLVLRLDGREYQICIRSKAWN